MFFSSSFPFSSLPFCPLLWSPCSLFTQEILCSSTSHVHQMIFTDTWFWQVSESFGHIEVTSPALERRRPVSLLEPLPLHPPGLWKTTPCPRLNPKKSEVSSIIAECFFQFVGKQRKWNNRMELCIQDVRVFSSSCSGLSLSLKVKMSQDLMLMWFAIHFPRVFFRFIYSIVLCVPCTMCMPEVESHTVVSCHACAGNWTMCCASITSTRNCWANTQALQLALEKQFYFKLCV